MLNWDQYEEWPAVKTVCERLNQSGYTAYLAGGCVRDALLGRKPQDFDVATDALPEQIEGLFAKTIAVGKAFGVIMVVEEGVSIEVATFRTDGPYLDGRHPSSIEYSSPKEDALRRDFTINALFFDLQSDAVVDFVGGREDLKKRCIRTVGDPYQRFAEDKLRPMRAVRFSTQLDFAIEKRTREAIQSESDKVKAVAKERLYQEMNKLLQAPLRERGVDLLVKTQLFGIIFPQYKIPHTDPQLWRQGMQVLSSCSDSAPLPEVYAALLWSQWRKGYEQDKALAEVKECEGWLRDLKVSNDLLKGVNYLLTSLTRLNRLGSESLAQRLRILDHPLRSSLFSLWQASLEMEGVSIEPALSLKKAFEQVSDHSGQLPKPFVDGQDLKALGVAPGPDLGRLLREVYDAQLEGRLQSKEEALSFVKKSL